MRNRAPIWLTLLVLSGQMFTPAGAGSQTAKVKKIADISGPKVEKINERTPRVRIQRRTTGRWLDAAPDTTIFWKEILKVGTKTRVKIRVDQNIAKGEIVCLADLPEYDRGEGFFKFNENFDRLGFWEILLAKGSLLADWSRGRLEVVAVNTTTRLTGTQVAFFVESDSAGFVFLKKGSIVFPDFPEIVTRPPDIVRLRAGQPPAIVNPPVQQVARVQRFVNYNGHEIWSQLTPLWQKPGFFIPAGAVAGLVAGKIIYDALKKNTARGTVTITIP